MTELWLPVNGYDGYYEVSNLGRVRSIGRVAGNNSYRKGRVLRPATHPNGYLQVHVSRDGARKTHWVHRLVLDAFSGPAPTGTEALHRDGNPANNTIENLEWGTRSQNMLDQVSHGSHYYASRTHCPKGHPYSPENTYRDPSGSHRKCRTCMRELAKRTDERRRAARRAA